MPPEELCIGGLISHLIVKRYGSFRTASLLVRDSVCGGVFPPPVLPLVAVASSGLDHLVFRQLQGPVMASYIMDRLGDLLRILRDQGGESCFPHLIWHTQYQCNWF